MQGTASPIAEAATESEALATGPRGIADGGAGELGLPVRPRTVLPAAAGIVLAAGLMAALLVGGLFLGPTLGLAAYAPSVPAQRPPIVPPSVPEGAREDWAVWTYVDKISQAWGRDWPHVIEWFEDLDSRYPNNPMVFDKLYAAYVEDGRSLQAYGDLEGARRRYEQAARYDPDRGVAQEHLADLDKLTAPRR